MKEYIVDIECDGLTPTRLHCMSILSDKGTYTTNSYDEMEIFIDGTPSSSFIIGHDFIRFDAVHIERLLSTKIRPIIIDTLALSWYLEPGRRRHGLESWGETFGYPKVEILDWENLSYEEYKERCERDVLINKKLWDYLKKKLVKLYGSFEKSLHLIRYLMFKMKCASLAEQTGWKLDKKLCEKNLALLTDIKTEKEKALSSVMPKVPNYVFRHKPNIMTKKDGSFTLAGLRWSELVRERPAGINSIKVIIDYSEPNPGSHYQIKDWLFSLGWEPDEWKEDVPQINKQAPGAEGCTESVLKLSEVEPAVLQLNDLFVCRHRLSILKGFLRDVSDLGYLTASVAGFTNTLRFKHSVLVNLPGMGTKYGEYIRPCLVAPSGYSLCGSDMSSLEDRTKQHFMYKYDPKYVREMQTPDFDPHLDLAVIAGMMTKGERDEFKRERTSRKKWKELVSTRRMAKTTNYACTYGAFPQKISQSAGIPLSQAKQLWDGYWLRNWSLKRIADDCEVKKIGDQSWLWNPVSKIWYSLRFDKDKFSTLNQGTGAYVFDRYLFHVLELGVKLLGQFHDEFIILTKDQEVLQPYIRKRLQDCIQKVNTELKLNRGMDISVQFGNNYGEIH